MTKSEKYQWIGLGLAFIIILLTVSRCGALKERLNVAEKCCEATKIEITPPDKEPVKVTTPVPIPKTVYIDTGSIRYIDTGRSVVIYDTITKTDTIYEVKSIVSDYFATRHYTDTLKDDESAFLSVDYSLSQNKMLGFNYAFQNRRGDRVIEKEKELKFRAYYGLSATYNMGNVSGEVNLSVVPRSDRLIITAGYDPFKNTWRAGGAFKIGGR